MSGSGDTVSGSQLAHSSLQYFTLFSRLLAKRKQRRSNDTHDLHHKKNVKVERI